MKEIFLSVVIPCYDEMANLQKGVLEKVFHFLNKKRFIYEVIVVDDGSKDGSDEFIENLSKEYPQLILIRNHHTGKAGAVTKGMLVAKGEYRLFTDMDEATPIEEIDKLLPYFEKNSPDSKIYDIVIGSRNKKRKGSPLIRQFISRANIVLRKIIVGLPEIMDTQCGFKMFNKRVAEAIFPKINVIHNGFRHISGSSVTSGFDVEVLYIAEKMGFTIKEVSVVWLYVESRHVNPIRDSYQGLKDLITIRMNRLGGKYE